MSEFKPDNHIIFTGQVCDGIGKFSKENIVRPLEKSIYPDWPTCFEPGTFNIKVNNSGWPHYHGLNFLNEGVRCMDRNHHFEPAHYLPYTYIPNNTLNPQNKGEQGGDLQFWRAVLDIETAKGIRCYMLRRVKSGYQNIIEIISDVHLREKYKVKNGINAKVKVLSG